MIEVIKLIMKRRKEIDTDLFKERQFKNKENRVLFKSLRNCKRRNKGMLCGGRGQYFLVLNKISTLI